MRYIFGIIFGFLIATGAYAWVFMSAVGSPPSDSVKRIGDWYSRKEELARAVDSPRILTISGSSGLYGVSSEMLSNETGIPSINFGTHAALSLDYLLTKAQGVARRGDVILLALEYEQYVVQDANAVFSNYVLGCDPGYIRTQSLSEQGRWFFSAPTGFLLNGLRERIPGLPRKAFPDHRGELNPFGDVLRNSVDVRLPPEAARLKAIRYLDALIYWNNMSSEKVWTRIAEFSKWCDANGVVLVATFPPTVWFPKYEEATVQDAMSRLVARFAEAGIPVLGAPQDFMLPTSDFFDTQYHLNADGRIKHTDHLIALLKPFLKEHVPASERLPNEN